LRTMCGMLEAPSSRLTAMRDPHSDIRGKAKQGPADKALGQTILDNDLLMETILENIRTTPIGQVLKRIGDLPEVRKNKVLKLRRSLDEGEYDIDDRLDAAIDRVLEDLTAQ
jgi:hypothetical protein